MEKKSADGRDTGVIEGFICGVVTGFCLPQPPKEGAKDYHTAFGGSLRHV